MFSPRTKAARAAILLVAPALLFGFASPAHAEQEGSPEQEKKANQRLISLCDRKHADCSYTPTKYDQKIGPRRQVGDAVFNCSGTTIDHHIEWSDTVGHSSTFSIGAEVSASIGGAVQTSYNRTWSWSNTVSQKDSLSVAAWQVAWIERAPLMQTVTGDHYIKVHFPRNAKYGTNHVIKNGTYTAPVGSQHSLIFNNRLMSDKEKAETCVGGEPGPRTGTRVMVK